MGWTIFTGCLMIVWGVFCAVKPELWWKLTEEWKARAADEPSDFYLRATRMGGIMLIVCGFLIAVAPIFLK